MSKRKGRGDAISHIICLLFFQGTLEQKQQLDDEFGPKAWCHFAGEGMHLDPRGGYFRQLDMQAAWDHAIAIAGCKDAMLIIAQANKTSYAEFIVDLAYGSRVIMSHTREKFRCWMKSQGPLPNTPELLVIFEFLKEKDMLKPTAAVGAKGKPKPPSLNPCPFFRDEESDNDVEDSDDGSDDDVPTCISTTYSPNERKAFMRLSDGSSKDACRYDPGEDGFIIAVWEAPIAKTLQVDMLHRSWHKKTKQKQNTQNKSKHDNTTKTKKQTTTTNKKQTTKIKTQQTQTENT